MIKQVYKGFFIVSEFNNLYDIRNNLGNLEAENFKTIREAKERINKWIN